jgi:hypothetical protein
MIRWIVGAAAAAVVMFLWGFVWWAALPFGAASLSTVSDVPALTEALRATLPTAGVYTIPGPAAPPEAWGGIFAQIFYVPELANPMTPGNLLLGWLHGFVAALLAGYLLAGVTAALGSYLKRVLFVALLGLFAAFVVGIGNVVWFHHPLSYHLSGLVFTVINWSLAGLVLAAIIKGKLKVGA